MTNAAIAKTAGLFSFPWWQWVIIIAALTVAICFLIWFIIKIARGKLKLGNIEIGGNAKDKDEQDSKNKLKCANCEEKGSLSFAIKSLLDLTMREHDLRVRGILASQMMKAEEHLLNLKNECLSAFSTKLGQMLKEKGDKTPPIQHNDYLYYKLVLQEFLTKMKDTLRAACINNGFNEMNPDQYNEYIQDRVDQITKDAIRFFEENYITAVVFTADHLRETPILLDEIHTKVKRIFDDLRGRANSKEVDIKTIRTERQNIIEGKIGIEGVV